jgi:hypothetical protein
LDNEAEVVSIAIPGLVKKTPGSQASESNKLSEAKDLLNLIVRKIFKQTLIVKLKQGSVAEATARGFSVRFEKGVNLALSLFALSEWFNAAAIAH